MNKLAGVIMVLDGEMAESQTCLLHHATDARVADEADCCLHW